jgi:hypothetical protein
MIGHDMQVDTLTGLWHTFHGVTEIAACRDSCTETVHELVDPKADVVGNL